MSGILIPLFSMRSFDFSFLTAGSKTIVVQPELNVARYYFARLIVRVHEIDMLSTGPTIKVSVFGTDPSKEDPRDFSLAASTLEVPINSSTSIGLKDDTDTDIYPYLKVAVIGTYVGAGRCFAVLSADLLLREA